MTKSLQIDGLSLYDFKKQIDYGIEEIPDRLDLVRRILDEKSIINEDGSDSRTYHSFFSTYFSSTPKFDAGKKKEPKKIFFGYDYNGLSEMYDEMMNRFHNMKKNEQRKVNQLKELLELLDEKRFDKNGERLHDNEERLLTIEKEEKINKLSKKFAKKIYIHSESETSKDTSFFPFYTPHIGTTNEMNIKQPNSGLKPLSEHDPVCSFLEQISKYITTESVTVSDRTQKDRSKKTVSLNGHKEYTIKMWKDRFKSREVKIAKSDLQYSKKKFSRGKHISKFPNFLIINRDESRDETENKMKKLNHDLDVTLQYLRRLKDDKRIDTRTRYIIRRWIGDIKNNQIDIKKSQHRYIDLRMLLDSSTVVDFNNDTGYIDANGEYKHISYNKIDFKDEKHVAGLIKHYHLIAECKDDFNSDMYWIISLLNRLINKADFKPEQMKILRWYLIDDMPIKLYNEPTTDEDGKYKCKSITEKLNEIGIDWDAQKVSRFIFKTAPKIIAEKYKDSIEDWTYTYKLRGEYGACTSCGKIRLVKYFGKDNRNKNGLKSICKICDKNKK